LQADEIILSRVHFPGDLALRLPLVISVGTVMKKNRTRWPMKIQKIFCMHTVMIGVAAALFLASSAPAQEIENTRWDEGSNVVAVQQPARVAVANDSKASALDSSASNSAAIAKPIAQESAVSRLNPVEGWAIALALGFAALLAPYRLARTKRAKQNSEAGSVQANPIAIPS
jgi:hypothetical protein